MSDLRAQLLERVTTITAALPPLPDAVKPVMETAHEFIGSVVDHINTSLKDFSPVEILLVGVLICVVMDILSSISEEISNEGGLWQFTKKTVFYYGKKIPFVASKVKEENDKVRESFEKDLAIDLGREVVVLPEDGLSDQEIRSKLVEYNKLEETKWTSGKISGSVYNGEKNFLKLVNEAYAMNSLTNPLHPDVFVGIRKMESELVRMGINIFNGDAEACGNLTSGGTESIILALRTYKEWGRREKGIRKPEIVIPVTAHAAFDKGADYFGIKLIHVPVGKDFRADVRAMERAITSNTIMMMGSAPCYPQGVIDPIEQLASIAKKRGIGFHVDCCLGGFFVNFLAEAGYNQPLFDFRVPGVTSISADNHKYGAAPKGVSTIMYRTRSLRHYQYFVAPDWTGGMYASPGIAGSRPGGLVAGAWTAMVSMGRKGYIECCRRIMECSTKIQRGIEAHPGLYLLGKPDSSVVCFSSNELDIYKVSEAMGKFGWSLNNLQNPKCIHICCTYVTRKSSDEFLTDLAAAYKDVKENPADYKDGAGAMYGMAASIPDRSIVEDVCRSFLDTLTFTRKTK